MQGIVSIFIDNQIMITVLSDKLGRIILGNEVPDEIEVTHAEIYESTRDQANE